MRTLVMVLASAVFWLAMPAATLAGSKSLLNYIDYEAAERDQGGCGNCWVWASTGAMEIARAVQEVGTDRLSIQLVNSCKTDTFACNGGNAFQFGTWYENKGYAVPWSNTNAGFQDADPGQATHSAISCNSIQQTPNHPITDISVSEIATHGIGQAAAIANIKNVLNQKRGVYLAFYMPTRDAWYGANGFQTWFSQTTEDKIWTSFSCGSTYVSGENGGGGHAVVLVGYNDDSPDPAQHYWLALNSWGVGMMGTRPNGVFRLGMNLNYDCSYLAKTGYAINFYDLSFTFPSSAACSYTIAPTAQSFGAGSGSGGINVTTQSGCSWAVSGVPSWITVVSGGSGRGSGAVTYNVSGNTTTQPRQAELTIAGQKFTITQEGNSNTLPVNILLNGNFEDDSNHWTESSSGGFFIISEDQAAHSGEGLAWLGGYNQAQDMIYQDIDIPSSATSASIDFYYRIMTDEAEGSQAYDKMVVAVVSSANNSVPETLLSLSNRDQTSNWTKSSKLDLSSYIGKTIRLTFSAATDDSAITSFLVDDVALSVTFPPMANLAPFQPSAWSDKIVVTNTPDSEIDSPSLSTNDSLYVKWAVANIGSIATSSSFLIDLYLDSVLRTSWSSNPLNVNSYAYNGTNYLLGHLAPGTHTLKIVADTKNNVAESLESDNSYTKTFLVEEEKYLISGTVHSGRAAGPPITGATVSMAGQTATTDAGGAFTITGIRPGTYTLKVSASGFGTYTKSSFVIDGNQSGLTVVLHPNGFLMPLLNLLLN